MISAAEQPNQRRSRERRKGGELEVIRAIGNRAARIKSRNQRELRLGIGDDCAILRPRPGEEIVVTTDFSLEGRHFRRDWHSPESIGHRALARGLSDLAAMGARPVAAFLSLALPRSLARNVAWLDGFLDGLLALANRAPVPLAGGDTSEAPGEQVLLDIVLLGAVPQGRALRRDGARVGDRLFVTGALGGAAAQLDSLRRGDGRGAESRFPVRGMTSKKGGASVFENAKVEPHFFPEPRLDTGQRLLRGGAATAALDLSDGLSTDLHHLCEASGVAAEIEASRLPLHPLLSGMNPSAALNVALHGGEDYELLFTVREGGKMRQAVGAVPVTEIGTIVARKRGRPRVTLVDALGKRGPLAPGGWEHLR